MVQSTEITLRPLTIADAGEAAATFARAYMAFDSQLHPDFFQDVENEHTMYERLRQPGVWGFAAMQASEMAGFALAYPSSMENSIATDPYIDHLGSLMVEPRCQRQGVGSMLLDMMELVAKERGKTKLSLWTSDRNFPAQALYEQKRFVRTGEKRTHKQLGTLVRYMLTL